jgi:hypothetical protein
MRAGTWRLFFVIRRTRQMTKDELKQYDQKDIVFTVEGKRGLGTLHYVSGGDRFQILYNRQQPEAHLHLREAIDLTDEMVQAIIEQEDNLVLDYAGTED